MSLAYTITNSITDLADHFGLLQDENYLPRYNARPSQLLPVITQQNSAQFSYFNWGTIPSWSKKKSIAEKLINIRSESVMDMPSYRASLEKRRCLIPANGFYGWKQISKKGQVPYRFVINNEAPFAMAGIWEEFESENGDIVHTFAIFTTIANEITQTVGRRMPVILKKEHYQSWLNGTETNELFDLLKPFENEKMTTYAVSPKVNDIELDSPEIIKPAAPADQFGNYSLFD